MKEKITQAGYAWTEGSASAPNGCHDGMTAADS